MRSQFWKQIETVDGQPIPDGVEFKHPDEKKWHPAYRGERWIGWPVPLEWRVPVEACPMSIAVDAIASSAQFNHDKQQYEVWIVDNYASGCTEQALKDAIASRLRELADKEFPDA